MSQNGYGFAPNQLPNLCGTANITYNAPDLRRLVKLAVVQRRAPGHSGSAGGAVGCEILPRCSCSEFQSAKATMGGKSVKGAAKLCLCVLQVILALLLKTLLHTSNQDCQGNF